MKINRQETEQLNTMLLNSARTVIVTHMRPDGDAMGSSTAMYHYLKQHTTADVRIVLNDRFQHTLDFLTEGPLVQDMHIFIEDSKPATDSIADADLLICLDFNAFHRTDNLCPLLESSPAAKVLIDHHLNPDTSSFDLIFSNPEISSTCELLYQILMAMPQIGNDATRLPKETATSLMTGMTTDTNNFANSVYPSTMLMASALLGAGVDRDNIIDKLYNQHSESRLRLMGHLMKDLLSITSDGAAYIILDKKTQDEYNVQEGDTEGFVNMPLSIAKVRMSILIKEDSGRLRVSIRSRKGTSANKCARMHFNGGGHENAAGGRLEIPVEAAAEYIEKHVHDYLIEEDEKND